LFTHLGLSATPGRRQSFVAKTPATEGGHSGLFTHLGLSATPGRRQSFVAKTPATIVFKGGPRGGGLVKQTDDDDMIEILTILMMSKRI
jgi:hypothetical protein